MATIIIIPAACCCIAHTIYSMYIYNEFLIACEPVN